MSQETDGSSNQSLSPENSSSDVETDKSLPEVIEDLQFQRLELTLQNEQLHQIQKQLQEEHQKFVDLYHTAPVAYFTFSREGLILDVNLTGATLLNTPIHQLIQQPLKLYLHVNSHQQFDDHRNEVLTNCTPQTCELILKPSLSEPNQQQYSLVYVEVHSQVAKNTKEPGTQCRSAMIDVTKRKQAEDSLQQAQARLEFEATHDNLTRLPNRVMLMRKLSEVIERSQQNRHYLFAVLFLDLDRFNFINDSFGHSIGDQFLIAIGKRLRSCIHPKNIIARLGGDEFVVILDAMQDITEAFQTADTIHNHLARSVELNGQRIFTTASIGIVLNTNQYHQPEELLRDADTAMYQAKAKGRGRHELFEIGHHAQVMNHLRLESDLWQAIEQDELVVHYQPILNLSPHQITSVESLVRWNHGARGLVSPSNFLPWAEESGLIVSIDRWVLRTVCTQAAEWYNQGHHQLKVTVNVSASMLHHPNFKTTVADTLHETGLPNTMLNLEISENVDWRDIDLQVLQQLSKIGVQISLDDFGTGHASLAHLKHLTLDYVKIDRSYIEHVDKNDKDKAIVAAMISLAHSLNLTVIAEGVETESQLSFLRTHQCDQVQGHLISKALTTQDLMRFLPE